MLLFEIYSLFFFDRNRQQKQVVNTELTYHKLKLKWKTCEQTVNYLVLVSTVCFLLAVKHWQGAGERWDVR